jgi:cyanobactin maturation PatA/PatG family protease
MTDISRLSGLQALWSETLGSPEICVAILDGPVDRAHPCFTGARLDQLATSMQNELGDDLASPHGTHVASVIFGQHGSAVKGIAPGCRGLIVPIYFSRDGDRLHCSQLDLARAINQAIELGAHVINISGGELSASGVVDSILAKAIEQCAKSGILIVAAAGNDGCRCLHVPAAAPTVLAVGAMDIDGAPLTFSNWGGSYREQGVLALGADVLGAASGGKVIAKTGTSFAAPIVAGVAALLLSMQIKRGQRPDPQKVRAAILESADPCDPAVESDCRRSLAGRLNIASAHLKLREITGSGIAGQAPPDATSRFFPASAVLETGTGANRKMQSIDARSSMSRELDQPTYRRNNMTEPASLPQPEFAEVGSQSFQATEYAAAAEYIAAPSVANVRPSAVAASDCSCQKTAAAPAIAYVLGQIGYDFGTESRRDSFTQLAGMDVYDPIELLKYLRTDPASAANLIWTLSLDATVVYAIQPYGPFASYTYDRLKEFLNAHVTQEVERVSIPGVIHGSARLLNGQEVPLLFPDLRGMYSWSTSDLILTTVGATPADPAAAALYDKKIDGVRNFLERIYYEVRNLGTSPQERAINYAATNAFQVSEVYNRIIATEMKLDCIDVERSPICRPGSDCWDVKLTFFNPAKRIEQARHVYRFTVDVSEVIPVTVGKIRHWDIY